ncbi:hypothetical protein QUB56_26395 [Microcoleus sp. AR_TQ3_B6]|uniref:hypothetical protein n=1 Tax=Microcoleus sp. AR_TQ3_B6 TaxID=3055284 RepID=UPI002FD57E12
MKSKNKHSLWVNLAVGDYFLVPNNLNLPDGNCAIRNLRGIEKQVDPDAIAPYEISAKDAEPYMRQEVTQAMEQISSLFSNVVAIALQNRKGNSTDAAKSADPTQPAASLLANLLGVSLDEFCDNPEVAKEGLQSFVAEVATAMQSSVAQNPDRTHVIQTSVDAVLETLQSRGLNIPDLDTNELIAEFSKVISEFPDELRSTFSKNSSNFETATTQLQEAALQIDQSFSNLAQTLTQSLTKLQNLTNKPE